MPTSPEFSTTILANLNTSFVGFSTTTPAASGGSLTNFTEPSTGGYARTAATFGSWSSFGRTNTSAVVTSQSTGAWSLSRITHWGEFGASSGGSPRYWDWLGKETEKQILPADINTSTNRITITSHGYSDANEVVLRLPFGSNSTLMGGVTAETRYYCKVIDANTIELYTDQALTTIVDISSVGSGAQLLFKVQSRLVDAADITLTVPIGSLSISNY